MIHEFLVWYFNSVLEWGYPGVFLMMAVESTVVPIPSEVIIPPAAYWAAQGDLSFWGVVLAGGLGSTFGSSLTYLFTYTLGRAFVLRWGRLFLLPPSKLAVAEAWLADFALPGVFLARLLPVVRHLIGFPAGLVRVPFARFAAFTFLGSTLWSAILAYVGAKTIGMHPELLRDPDALTHVIKEDLVWFVALVLVLGIAWIGVAAYGKRVRAASLTPQR
jgi:membrane protein DedA with SNARE-associated domain